MWSILKYLIVLSVINGTQSYSESKMVKIEQGQLRGYRYQDQEYFAFMSVPYATSPPGKDRFKPPLPAPVWMETFDAIETGSVCPQALPLPKIREDCLIANIFVPDTNVTNLPVMVYVHGGAFVITSGDYFRFTKLVGMKRAIVVTFNYRLGVHGFLCLGTKSVPGNAGMKDQIALLRWVQRNIASFGGNPDEVTVVGCSSGGNAIDLLSLSPMAKGLFHKVIIEGGASLSVTNVQLDPIDNAKTYAKILNFTNVDNVETLENFYLTASYELLTSHTDEIVNREDSTILFTPCIERDTGTGEEMFLTEAPWFTLKRGKYERLPMMIGYSEMEATNRIFEFINFTEKMNKNFSKFLPGDLQFASEDEKETIAENVKHFYFGNKIIDEESIIDCVTYFSDITHVFPVLRSLNLRWEAGNETIYLFEYLFVDEYTEFVSYTNVKRAGHCSLMDAVKDQDYTLKTNEYSAMKETLRDIWLNFISTGKPVPEGSALGAWPSIERNWSPYMSLFNATPVLKKSLSVRERANFWVPIYKKYHRHPIPPSHSTTFHTNIGLVSSRANPLVLFFIFLLMYIYGIKTQ